MGNIAVVDFNTLQDMIHDWVEHDLQDQEMKPAYLVKKYGVTKTDAVFYINWLANRDFLIDLIKDQEDKSAKDTKLKEIARKLKEFEKRNKTLETIAEAYKYLKSTRGKNKVSFKQIDVKATSKSGKNPAVAISIMSDVHLEEDVNPEIVLYQNKYNLEIAKERCENFFKNTLRMVDIQRSETEINTLILGLLGDFITGEIHEELKMTNNLGPLQATAYMREILTEGILYLVEHGNFENIVIPCTKGNHGRTTHRKTFNTGWRDSYEWQMYQDLANWVDMLVKAKGYKTNILFDIPKSEYSFIDIWGYKMRFCHGDHFRYNGGIGGITIPLIKWLHKRNESDYCDMTFMGHWHNIHLEITPNCMVNGSIIGTNAYSIQFGGIRRRPQQIFALLDKDRGFSVRAHIDVLPKEEMAKDYIYLPDYMQLQEKDLPKGDYEEIKNLPFVKIDI